MKDHEHSPEPRAHCMACGAELVGPLTSGLCPKCLLKTGLESPSNQQEVTTAVVSPPPKPTAPLEPKDQFGHYRIIRRLGGGGMGTVFEAEDLENGRRVALKVLSQTLDSPDGRERFFREGRLAASINHPNSVYVFGTEEVAGTPVIAMELVAGGTLEDRVRTRGPLPSAEAVDAILQIISGLEAAQRIGILHRDVKPSNCFVDPEGTVKIGDFGLSISTSLRTEPALTTSGSFLGTPGFCSPEQLRGEELNVRSDIYSVGMTLFYLLTGRAPFEVKNVVAMIATVLEQPAPSPRKWCPRLPYDLAKAVQRCLEKEPGERFKSYEELRMALEPYSSAAPIPAALPLRLAAGVVDTMIVSSLAFAVVALTSHDLVQLISAMTSDPWKWLGAGLGGLTGSILYYAILEGIWGATAGKALCRLRVINAEKASPGVVRGLLRAGIYVIAPIAPFWLIFGGDWRNYVSQSTAMQLVPTAFFYGMLALLFVTARRANGYAAIHELASGTRVICRMRAEQRPVLTGTELVPAGIEKAAAVGPYHVLQTIETGENESWLLGYDLRLLRRVWLHLVPRETPPVPPSVRHLARVGRLRWLTGRRSQDENWDAFEAVSGKSLPQLVSEGAQPWSQVRFWIADLARELAFSEKEGTLPATLALDRVWITAEGRAKLLDFRGPGVAPEADSGGEVPTSPPGSVQMFLSEVAGAALQGQKGKTDPDQIRRPLPVHAREFLRRLGSFPNIEAASLAIGPLLRRPTEVTRARRAAIIGACLVVPTLSILAVSFGVTVAKTWEKKYPGLMQLNMLLSERTSRNFLGKTRPSPTDRQLAIYIASHFRGLITNPDAWSNMLALSLIKGEGRKFAEQSVADFPAPTAEEIRDAEMVINPRLPKVDFPDLQRRPFFPLLIFTVTLAIYVCIPALLAAVVCRGGLILLIAGVSFVRRDGARASRVRLLWRSIAAWSLIWPTCIMAAFYMEKPLSWPGILFFIAIFALTLASVGMPQRGLPDRLAGTWPVPR